MKQMKKLLSVLLAVLMVFSLMSTAMAAQAAVPLKDKVVILHSNDVHGAVEGYAKIAALRDEYVKEGAEVILADAGDYCQGTAYVSLSKGAKAVEMMNAVGYDVSTLGNHEFDFGYENLMAILKNAKFKVVCGDVFKDGKSILDGWTIIEKKGVKIGFVGLETPETYTKVNPGLIQGVSFPQKEELYTCAQKLVDEVKAAGADVVVGLFHLGVDEESTGNRSMDVYANVQGLDLILDGHSHTTMLQGVDKIKIGVDENGQDKFDVNPCKDMPIQSTGTKFANVGVVVIDPAEKKIVENKLVPAEEIKVADDNPVLLKAKEIEKAVDDEYGAIFAKSEVELNGDKSPGNRNMETNLGDLITDAMVWAVLKDTELKVPEENVVGITNGGGIRAWVHEGDVTMKDLNTVLPFGNTVAVIYVTGAELLEALEASCFMAPGAVGGFPQISGMKIAVDTDKPFDQGEKYPESTYYAPKSIQRVTINEINGKPFDKDATYAVVTNNFCAAGGDTYYAFKAASDQFDTSIPMDEALMNYVKEELKGVIGADYVVPQGRIDIPYMDLLMMVNLVKSVLPDVKALDDASAKALADATDAANAAKTVADMQKAYDDLVAAARKMTFKDNTFKDVKADDWFKPAVDFAQAVGLMDGVGNDLFAPKSDMTRAMVVTVLYRYAGSPDVTGLDCPFKDLTQDWYKDAVTWASYMSITTGTSDHEFSPNAPVTREQMATFVSRFMFGSEGGSENVIEELRGTLAREFYLDTKDIHNYAVEHVFACTVNAIMRGDEAPDGGTTTFRPLDTMNRAECAQVLKNVYDFVLDSVLPKADAAPAALRPAA